MRLDKFLAHTCYASRNVAKKAIRRKLVKVNGQFVTDYEFEINGNDVIEAEGKEIPNRPFVVVALNKPEGYMCSMIDELYPSVMNLFPDIMRSRLRMVGRLDQDTTGLLLLTDNGKLNQRLMHPKTEVPKTYLVEVNHPLREDLPALCNQPLDIGKGEIALPSKVEIIDEYHAYITVSEGKYHEVKRIFAHFSYLVTKLKRVSLGPIQLGDLEEGKYRELNDEEVDWLFEAAKLERTENL
jgi:16S rRNA pseudouridine516 synthase